MTTFDTTTVDSSVYDQLSIYSSGTTTTSSTDSTDSSNDTTSLGYEDYLSLINAQLENQDPFEPMSNADMASQLNSLAQLNSIEDLNTTMSDGLADLQSSFDDGLSSLTSSIDTLNATLLQGDSSEAANYIGHWVYSEGEDGMLYDDQPLAAQLEIPDDAESLTLNVVDDSGDTVASYQTDDPASGLIDFSWDGRLGDLTSDAEEGSYETADAGRYTLQATATVDGEEQSVTTYTAGYVTSALLNTDAGTVLEREGLDSILPSQVTRLC